MALAVLAGLTVVAPEVLAASPANAATTDVAVADNVFTPPGVAVRPGDSVRWTYSAGSAFHNVRFEDGDGALLPAALPQWTVTRTFTGTATYRYYCEVHGGPGGQGVAGVVHVNAGASIPGLAPSASFVVRPTVGVVGGPVVVDAAAATDPDDSINRYEWDFDGDGTFETDGGASR